MGVKDNNATNSKDAPKESSLSEEGGQSTTSNPLVGGRQDSCFITSHSLQDYECFVPKYVKKRLLAEVQRGEQNFTGNEKLFAALLFADISGFTRLSSRLNAEELKHHINEYFSKMLDVIYSHSGDVVKFCGDAVLIMWTVPLHAHSNQKRSVVVKAALCALQLVSECGNYCKPIQDKRSNESVINAASLRTDISAISLPHHRASFIAPEKADIELSLHCGIGCGDINCMIVGNNHRRELIISGDVLQDMGKAEAQAGPNEVCVTAICYSYLKKYFYMVPAQSKTGPVDTVEPVQASSEGSNKAAGDAVDGDLQAPPLVQPAFIPNHAVAYILCGRLAESFKLFLLSKNLLTTARANKANKSGSLKPNSSEDENIILGTEKTKFSTKTSAGPVKRLGMTTRRFGRKYSLESSSAGNHKDAAGEQNTSEYGTLNFEPHKRISLITGSLHMHVLSDMSNKFMDSISTFMDFRGGANNAAGMAAGSNSESNPSMDINSSASNRNSLALSQPSLYQSATSLLPFDYDQAIGVAEMKVLFNACSDPVLCNMFPVETVVQGRFEEAADGTVEEVLPPIMTTLLRSFVHETALSAIDSNTHAMLSENREIATVFLMVKGLEVDLQLGIANRPQEFFLQLLKTTQVCGGSLRQFVVDDKGCVAIVCFGLFGSSNANNALQAVRCAIQLHNVIHKQGVFFSAGVTYGSVYCGNVGSKARCEFCVMGSSVNLAARLMAACDKYNQTIMVDEEVHNLISSKIQFQQMASIPAKGYDHPIAVFSPISKPNASNLITAPTNIGNHGATRRSLRISIGNSSSDKRSLTSAYDLHNNNNTNNTSSINVLLDSSVQFIRTIQELNESYQRSLLHSPIVVDTAGKTVPKLKGTPSTMPNHSDMCVKFIPPEREEDISRVLAQLKINQSEPTLSPHASARSHSANSAKIRNTGKHFVESGSPLESTKTTNHPFSILVTGPEGSGKTSFMQRLCYDLADTLPADSIVKYIDCNVVKPSSSPFAVVKEVIRTILQESEKRAKRERLEHEFAAKSRPVQQQQQLCVSLPRQSTGLGGSTTASQSLSSTSSITRMTMTESDVTAIIDRSHGNHGNHPLRRLNSGSFQCNSRAPITAKKPRRRRSSDGSIRMTQAVKSLQKPRRQTVHNCISAAMILEGFGSIGDLRSASFHPRSSSATTLLKQQFAKLKNVRDVVEFCTGESCGSFAFEQAMSLLEIAESAQETATIFDLLSEKVTLTDFLQSCSAEMVSTTSSLNADAQWGSREESANQAVIEVLYGCVLLLLFGLDPTTRQLGSVQGGLGPLAVLLDDLHCADTHSLKILSHVIARLNIAHRPQDTTCHGCFISSWMVKDTDHAHHFYQREHILSRTIQPFASKHKPGLGTASLHRSNNWQREIHLAWKTLSEDIIMGSLAHTSIKGLLHSFLGEKRWEWLLRKTASNQAGNHGPPVLPMFGRRKAFVAELFQSIEESGSEAKEELLSKEEVRAASESVVNEVFGMTLQGSPALVYELLSSLRQSIDRGMFSMLSELPVMKQRKKKVFEWLDSLNGSELAILKASSVIGNNAFNMTLLCRGLMSLDMEYCCAEMVMKSALMRLQRVGIIRRTATADHHHTLVESYEFCDEATRIAVYNLMLESQRAAVHGAIAKYYEELHPSTTSTTLLHRVYEHYMRSGAVDKMTEYNISMMQASTQQHQYLQALQFSTTLLSLVSGMKEKVILRSMQSHWEKMGTTQSEAGWVDKHWRLRRFHCLSHRNHHHNNHYRRASAGQSGSNRFKNGLSWAFHHTGGLFVNTKEAALDSVGHRCSRTAFTTLLDHFPAPVDHSASGSTRQHRGSSMLSSTHRRLTTLSWHTMTWTNRVAAADQAGAATSSARHGFASPLGSSQAAPPSPTALRGDYSCKLATLYGKFLLHQHLDDIADRQKKILRGDHRRLSARSASSSAKSASALLTLKQRRDFSLVIFNIKREYSIQLPLLAYILERSSYFYWCLGHCAKSEDCLALALSCLRAHRLQNLDAHNQQQRSIRVLSTQLPPNQTQPAALASPAPPIANPGCGELIEIEQLCQERLSFSLWMKGDLLACLALLAPVSGIAAESITTSFPGLAIYSCVLRASHCMEESLVVSRVVLQKFLTKLRCKDDMLLPTSSKTMVIFAMGFHYICEGKLTKAACAWRQVLQSAKDAQNTTMTIASMVLLVWTSFLQGDYFAIEDGLSEIQQLQQHGTDRFEDSISKTLWLEVQLLQRSMALLQACCKPASTATAAINSHRVYQTSSKKEKVFSTMAPSSASTAPMLPANTPSSISPVSPLTSNFFRGMLGHHEWVERAIHLFQKTIVFKTSSYYNVEKTDERFLIQDMNRLLLIYLHNQHPLDATDNHNPSSGLEDTASANSPWHHKYKSSHQHFVHKKIQTLFFSFLDCHQLDSTTSFFAASCSSTSTSTGNHNNTHNNEDGSFKTSPFHHTFAFMLLLSVSQYLYHQLVKSQKQRLLRNQCELLVLWWHALAEFSTTIQEASSQYEVLQPLRTILLVQLELICRELQDDEGKVHPLLKCMHEHVCARLKFEKTTVVEQFQSSCLPWLRKRGDKAAVKYLAATANPDSGQQLGLYQQLMEHLEQQRLLWAAQQQQQQQHYHHHHPAEQQGGEDTPRGSEEDSQHHSEEEVELSPASFAKKASFSSESIGDLYAHLLHYLDAADNKIQQKTKEAKQPPSSTSTPFADWMVNWQLDKLRELFTSTAHNHRR